MARGKGFWLTLVVVAVLGIGAGVGIGAAAFGGGDHGGDSATAVHGGDHSTPLPERDFLEMMIPHHQSAVAMAEVALQRASDPRIKDLAERIISSQEAEIEQMTGLLGEGAAGETDAHPSPGDSGGDMVSDPAAQQLGSVPSAEFDEAFLREMIPHHASAIVMAQQVQLVSPRPEVATLAKQIIAAQAREIGEMQGWLAG